MIKQYFHIIIWLSIIIYHHPLSSIAGLYSFRSCFPAVSLYNNRTSSESNRASFPKEPLYCYTSLLTFHGRTPLIPPWYRLRIHKKTDIWLLKIVAWHAHGGLNQNFSFTSLQLLKKAWDCIQSNVCGLWCFPNDLDWFLLIECLWGKSPYTLFSKRNEQAYQSSDIWFSILE